MRRTDSYDRFHILPNAKSHMAFLTFPPLRRDGVVVYLAATNLPLGLPRTVIASGYVSWFFFQAEVPFPPLSLQHLPSSSRTDMLELNVASAALLTWACKNWSPPISFECLSAAF